MARCIGAPGLYSGLLSKEHCFWRPTRRYSISKGHVHQASTSTYSSAQNCCCAVAPQDVPYHLRIQHNIPASSLTPIPTDKPIHDRKHSNRSTERKPLDSFDLRSRVVTVTVVIRNGRARQLRPLDAGSRRTSEI